MKIKLFQSLAKDSELLRRPAATSGEGQLVVEVADGAHRQREEGEERRRRLSKFHLMQYLALQ